LIIEDAFRTLCSFQGATQSRRRVITGRPAAGDRRQILQS